MDPLKKLDLAWDTSLHLARELHGRGHKTFLFEPESLSLESGKVTGRGQLIQPLVRHRYHLEPSQKKNLAEFDTVFIRKDPPFNSGYLSLTYLLEPLAEQTCVINHPKGLRDANEKLFGLSFSRWLAPTLVSADTQEILAFQNKIRCDLVIKPLYEKGGKGVFRLKRGEVPEKLNKATRGGFDWVIAQKFIPVPKGRGDKRILLWKGEILGAFERIPPPGDFRSNLSLGGKFIKCSVTPSEKKLVQNLRSAFSEKGLFFVGIDVREGFLIEINVTSPAGLVELDQLYGGASARMASDLERPKKFVTAG